MVVFIIEFTKGPKTVETILNAAIINDKSNESHKVPHTSLPGTHEGNVCRLTKQIRRHPTKCFAVSNSSNSSVDAPCREQEITLVNKTRY